MKKNKALTAAFSVFALTMVSMCAIGGTFAKYAAQGSAEDEARVAKWGVVVSVSGDEAFGEKYNDEISATGTKVISSSAGTNVLGPGTNGTLGGVSITGTPEVRVEVVVGLDLELTNWEIPEEYCPIVFTVGTTDYYIGADGINTISDLESAVENAASKVATQYDANTVLEDQDFNKTVTWSWKFDHSSEIATVKGDINTAKSNAKDETEDAALEEAIENSNVAILENAIASPSSSDGLKAALEVLVAKIAELEELEGLDAKDSALGDLAADGSAPTISATWSASVTQVD